jgi:outer membrane lipoprotein-sorting protein
MLYRKEETMQIFRIGSLLALIGLLLAACAPGEVTADEIKARMETARNNLQTAHVIADVALTSPQRSGTFTIESWAKKTDKTDAAGKPIGKLHAKVLNASEPDLVNTEFISNGETFWLYSPKANKVITGKLSELKQGHSGAADPAAQMLRMQEMLQQLIDGSNVTIENRSEQVANRDTWKIRLTPKPETQQQLQLGNVIDTTLWVDKQSDLPIKALIDAKDLGKLEATATTLDLNQPLADDRFSFTPPAGAEVINAAEIARQARPQTTTLEEARKQVSFSVLAPNTLPDGTQLDDVQVLRMRGETVIQNYSGALNFSLVQGKGSLPGENREPAGATTQQVTVRGQSATLITGGGAEQGTFLRWQENGATIVIAGPLTPDEAARIAESLK